MHTNSLPPRIKDGTGTVGQLREWAEALPKKQPLINWLRQVFDMNQPTLPRSGSGMADGTLRFKDLNLFAREWESIGSTTPMQFIDGLEPEVYGTPAYVGLHSILDSLGN
jgi:hypothetical protein